MKTKTEPIDKGESDSGAWDPLSGNINPDSDEDIYPLSPFIQLIFYDNQ